MEFVDLKFVVLTCIQFTTLITGFPSSKIVGRELRFSAPPKYSKYCCSYNYAGKIIAKNIISCTDGLGLIHVVVEAVEGILTKRERNGLEELHSWWVGMYTKVAPDLLPAE